MTIHKQPACPCTLFLGLLGAPASESGRLCHGDGGHGRGDRRRKAFMLPILHSRGQRGIGALSVLVGLLLIVVALGTVYVWVMLKWSYSSGERAGWVQKLSHKGWICKTWEGEMAMVSMPGTATEKFLFTVWNDAAADQINKLMGRRVALHYEYKMGLPTSCFGETRYFVTRVTAVEEIPLAPGIVVPTPSAPPRAPTAPAK